MDADVIFGDDIHARGLPSRCARRREARSGLSARHGPPGCRGTDPATFHFATSSMANEVIYGSTSNRKVRTINKLLIDDQRRHQRAPTSSLATSSMREPLVRMSASRPKSGA